MCPLRSKPLLRKLCPSGALFGAAMSWAAEPLDYGSIRLASTVMGRLAGSRLNWLNHPAINEPMGEAIGSFLVVLRFLVLLALFAVGLPQRALGALL